MHQHAWVECWSTHKRINSYTSQTYTNCPVIQNIFCKRSPSEQKLVKIKIHIQVDTGTSWRAYCGGTFTNYQLGRCVHRQSPTVVRAFLVRAGRISPFGWKCTAPYTDRSTQNSLINFRGTLERGTDRNNTTG